MASGKVSAKFVSQKISKVRWRPSQNQIVENPTFFVSGSWDNDVNKLSLWTLEQENMAGDMMDSDDTDPQLVCDAPHPGNVTGLEFLSNTLFMSTSSNGSAQLNKYHVNTKNFSVSFCWENLHRYHNGTPAPCTSLATQAPDEVITAGQDGRLCVLHLQQKTPTRCYETADSCSINAVSYVSHTEVATVNSTGHLRVWDLRRSDNDPVQVLLPSGELTVLHCLARHPTQPHILVTGGADGVLTIWDIRQDRFPVTLLQAHSSDMWEVKFHPTHPDYLFTCSEDGSLWLWDATDMQPNNPRESFLGRNVSMSKKSFSQSALDRSTSSTLGASWLSSDISKHRMTITDLLNNNILSVNSLDISGSSVICGTDNEQIYTISGLLIK